MLIKDVAAKKKNLMMLYFIKFISNGNLFHSLVIYGLNLRPYMYGKPYIFRMIKQGENDNLNSS